MKQCETKCHIHIVLLFAFVRNVKQMLSVSFNGKNITSYTRHTRCRDVDSISLQLEIFKIIYRTSDYKSHPL